MTTQQGVIETLRKEQEEFDDEYGQWEKVEIGEKKTFLFDTLVLGENPKVETKEGDYGVYKSYTFKVVNLATKTQKQKSFSCSKKLADAIMTGIEGEYTELVIHRKSQNQYQVLPALRKKESK